MNIFMINLMMSLLFHLEEALTRWLSLSNEFSISKIQSKINVGLNLRSLCFWFKRII